MRESKINEPDEMTIDDFMEIFEGGYSADFHGGTVYLLANVLDDEPKRITHIEQRIGAIDYYLKFEGVKGGCKFDGEWELQVADIDAESVRKKRIESVEAIAGYIRAMRNRTPEMIAEQNAEIRAAFGPGEKIVDILTGEVVYT